MPPRIVERPEAIRDLEELAEYIAQRSVAAGERFYDAVKEAYRRLAEMPEAGSRWESDQPALRDVRCWTIRRFRNYVIFYRPLTNGIEILRVLRGARNLRAIMGG
jgi:toxin ParE1/3/4